MITDEMLCTAAARSNELFVQAVTLDYDPAQAYEPSELFQKKIKRLFRRAKHPFFYQTMRRVAAIFLAAILAGSVYLAVDTEARAAFFGWVRELYENSTVYHVMPSYSAEKLPRYELTWLPDGFGEPDVYEDDTMYTALYENPDTGDFFVFDYCLLTEETQTELFTIEPPEHLLVNGMDADFYAAPDDSDSSNLLWVDTATGVFCSINSTLSKEDILRIAESITLADNSPAPLPRYELTWLPDGFGEPDVYEDDTSYSALYEDPNTGDFLVFEYCLLTDEHLVQYLTTQQPEPLIVNGFDADFYAAVDDSDCSNLLWVDSEAGVLCFLDSTLSKEDILRIAESISLSDTVK